MALSDDDVREILRLIDESDLDELLIETDGFKLHVLRGRPQATGHRPQAETRNPTPETPSANGATIDAPMLGTFYRAEAPGAAPFVDVGAKVSPDTTVCLIEVMKMMNSIPAGVEGTIAEVCAENAALVEYGQPLFRVEPA
ncbi:MAG TPA: biotin/lipoyl-containing protein [Thermoleophilaceae bacterium]|nr:biotin/lipoyl-containing protein [Thermoleophilaceae bacterium]